MKNFLIILFALILFSCNKDEEIAPVELDFAPVVAGTYVGAEEEASPSPGNITFQDMSKTLTVAIRNKNEVLISTFNGGSSRVFKLKGEGYGNVFLEPGSGEIYGPASNTYYNSSTGVLKIQVKSASGSIYTFFQGTKQ